MTRFPTQLLVSAALAIVFMPALARADTTIGTLPASSASGTSSSNSQATSGSALQATGQSATSSNATLSVLQPANGAGSSSSLQSANANGAGLGQANAQDLQQSGTSDQAQLLIGGAAGQPQQLDQSLVVTWLGYVLLVFVATTVLTAAVWLLQRRRWLPVSLPV